MVWCVQTTTVPRMLWVEEGVCPEQSWTNKDSRVRNLGESQEKFLTWILEMGGTTYGGQKKSEISLS